jgi:hypothetical protein
MDRQIAILVREVSRTQDDENADVQDAQNADVQDAQNASVQDAYSADVQDAQNASVQDAYSADVQDASTDFPQCLRPNKGRDPFPYCISPKPGIRFKCEGFVGQIFKIRRSSGMVEDGWTLHPSLNTGVNYTGEYILCENTIIDKMRHVSLDDLFTLNPQFNVHGY